MPQYAAASANNERSMPSVGSITKPAMSDPAVAPIVFHSATMPVVRIDPPSSCLTACATSVKAAPDSSDTGSIRNVARPTNIVSVALSRDCCAVNRSKP